MKRVYISVALTCLAVLSASFGWVHIVNPSGTREHLIVGFVCDGDESTPYTYNFTMARDAVEKKYGDQVELLTRSNVMDSQIADVVQELTGKGCDILFFNGYSELVAQLALDYPDVQFCQVSYMDMSDKAVPVNYHTFKGEIYQGRYVSGIAAGMKIQEMILEGAITEEQALVGFVASYPTPEVISGYTAFLLGVRSIVPQAVMRVRYTGSWSNYVQEKSAAQQLIDEGCVVISHHTDTIGSAIACEEAASEGRIIYHIGYNQSMTEVAPRTALVAVRTCWEPYVVSAVDALIRHKNIEATVSGHVHGTDISAGFESGWVEMVELNQQLVAPGTQETMNSVINQFRRSNGDFVFKGNYIGINPDNPNDTYDLKLGYVENEISSYPTFHYILSDVIAIE